MKLTRCEYTMMHLTGVAGTMITGWILSKDVMGVFMAGLLGTILVSLAFYPQQHLPVCAECRTQKVRQGYVASMKPQRFKCIECRTEAGDTQ